MADRRSRRKPKKPGLPPKSTGESEVFAATLGAAGSVIRGQLLTETQAVARRKSGLDVVVCGTTLSANRSLALTIERGASGKAIRCPPHANAGPNALPHYQPESRPPDGHTFYETPNRKVV